jgi:hypothetical protein
MLLYSATVFLSAFLLFLVQPVISKQILPWFGGSASVWTTCLVFFQTALLMGYLYADACVRWLAPRRQALLHTVLLAGSLAILPVIPGAHWRPNGANEPSWLILGLLAVSIGLPYVLLSATSPLVQAWLARSRPSANPYRLFALSNVASMLALVGYPLLLEPWSPTRIQALGWSVGYALFAPLCIAAAWMSLGGEWRAASAAVRGAVGHAAPALRASPPPTLARQVLWCALAATASTLLLAVTNQVTRNIAAAPLLWIAPLAAYLLTFILVFDSSGWYRPRLNLPLAAAGIVLMAAPLPAIASTHALALEVGAYLLGLFVTCMFAHGELARLQPSPRYLTRYYLMISLGGASGAALVGIAAPLLLPGYFELPITLTMCGLLLYWQVRTRGVAARAGAVVAVLAAAFCGSVTISSTLAHPIAATRNFYGVLSVIDRESGTNQRQRMLTDGTTLHGTQLLSPGRSAYPTAYYTPASGIGRLLTALRRRSDPLHVGIIGLGAGTLAAYGRQGDSYRFYEINPAVIRIANEEFSFLRDSAAETHTALGDARLMLERESPRDFDVLAVDAFSSDAIPVHLLTYEAVALYRRHIRPDGAIAIHVSNRFLDLTSVVARLAVEHRLRWIAVGDPGRSGVLAQPSVWVLLSASRETLETPELTGAALPASAVRRSSLWTDDFNNLVQALK